jgi:hypothetical protein
MIRTYKWYEIDEDHQYLFNTLDKVKFYDHGSDSYKNGVIITLCSFARWKITETRNGWWIFSKRTHKYEAFEASYIIECDDKQKYVVEESDIKKI